MSAVRVFQKRPIRVRAEQWTGGNTEQILDFTTLPANAVGGAAVELFVPLGDMNDLQWARESIGDDAVQKMLADGATGALYVAANCQWLGIETGEWIIQDENGFYPCKPATFGVTYEEVHLAEPESPGETVRRIIADSPLRGGDRT
ncbi:hypothetical protein [Rhodococcoides fascians]|uniref:hypothetical protein n=1 Tax=Rhodococcoides fascians TaxID=1828 RepID=UPI00050C9593|nr:hypothetical protein [Rhodococcus fascians]